MSQSKRGVRWREHGLFGQAVVETGDRELVCTVRLALRMARKHLAEYAHVTAPKKFTQPQLFACSVPHRHWALNNGAGGFDGDSKRRERSG